MSESGLPVTHRACFAGFSASVPPGRDPPRQKRAFSWRGAHSEHPPRHANVPSRALYGTCLWRGGSSHSAPRPELPLFCLGAFRSFAGAQDDSPRRIARNPYGLMIDYRVSSLTGRIASAYLPSVLVIGKKSVWSPKYMFPSMLAV